jgi:pimeloyl-ACP methyl ester carboxylesterase
VSEGSLPDTIKKTAADVSRLARLQVELAKERAQAKAKKKAIFAGMGMGGMLLLLYAILFLLAAGAAGLAVVFPVWLAILIVGGGLLFVGAIMLGVSAAGLKGRKAVPEVPSAEAEVTQPWLQAKTS